jgi:hypothetical protein
MFAFIQTSRGQVLSLEHANSLDGATGATSGDGDAGAPALVKIATAPITIRGEIWSRFMVVLGGRTTIGLRKLFTRGIVAKKIR